MAKATDNPPDPNAGAPVLDPTRSWNLALRGLLELSGLVAIGYWGFEKGDGAGWYALMAGVPVLAAATCSMASFPGGVDFHPVIVLLMASSCSSVTPASLR